MTKSRASTTPSDFGLDVSSEASPADRGQTALDQDFSEMVENYAGFAYNVAYRMLRNVEDAEDAVQEAFISAYRALSTFKGQSQSVHLAIPHRGQRLLDENTQGKIPNQVLSRDGLRRRRYPGLGQRSRGSSREQRTAWSDRVGITGTGPRSPGCRGASGRARSQHWGSGRILGNIGGCFQVPVTPRPHPAAQAHERVFGEAGVCVR